MTQLLAPTRTSFQWRSLANHFIKISFSQSSSAASPLYYSTSALRQSPLDEEYVSGVVPTTDPVNERKKKLWRITLGDFVEEAKQRRQDSKKNNLDLYKNFFVTAIKDTASVKETVDFMVDRQVGSLFVVDKSNTIKGFVTEHSIVFSELLFPELSNNTKDLTFKDIINGLRITDVMKPVDKLVVAKSDAKLLHAFHTMRDNDFRHLPVLSETDSAPTNIASIAHIISVKGLISKLYSTLTDLPVMSSPVQSGSHSNEGTDKVLSDEWLKALERLEKLETDTSNEFGLPMVKSVLKYKADLFGEGGDVPKILNTDIKDDISVADAIEEMRNNRVGYVAVMDFSSLASSSSSAGTSTLIGIVTERDILQRVLAANLDPNTTLLRDVMTKKSYRILEREKSSFLSLCSVRSSDSLLTCMRLMSSFDVRHLPVVSRKVNKNDKKEGEETEAGKIIGVITSKDVVTAICKTKELLQ